MAGMKKRNILQVGDSLNSLTVLEFSYKDKRNRRFLKFKCECGNEKVIQASLVTSGNTKSCGCWAKKVRRLSALPGSDGAINQLILGYKRHAKARGFIWSLTREDVVAITTLNCHYCGSEPANIKKGFDRCGDYTYSGIDRKDSSLGYFKENCLPACKICNFAKSNMSYEQFRKWATAIGAMAQQWSL